LGYGLGRQWAALFGNGIAPPETYVEVVGAALVFGFLVWQIPSLAGSLMNGAPRMTLGTFLNTASTVAVGGVVIGSGIGAVAAAAAPRSSGNSDTLQASGDAGDFRNAYALTTAPSVREGGRSAKDIASEYGLGYSSDLDSFATGASSKYDAGSHERNAVDATPENATEETRASQEESSSESTLRPRDSTEADVTAEETDTTRASDAEVAAEDNRLAREAERRDVQSGVSGSTPSGLNPMQGFRQLPVPDDSADGNIQIRFKHPE
jgi:type IV secretion system protein TrbL